MSNDYIIFTITMINSLHIKYVELMLEKTLGNKILATTLFEKLFISLPVQLNDLSKTLKNNDLGSAKLIAHEIHGVVANCGLINLEYYAQIINHYLSINDIDKAEKFFLILKEQTDLMFNIQNEILVSLR